MRTSETIRHAERNDGTFAVSLTKNIDKMKSDHKNNDTNNKNNYNRNFTDQPFLCRNALPNKLYTQKLIFVSGLLYFVI